MMGAASRLVPPAEKFSFLFLRLGLAEGEELEANILSQDFAGLRGGSSKS